MLPFFRLMGECPAQNKRNPGVDFDVIGELFERQPGDPVARKAGRVVDQDVEIPGTFEGAFDERFVFFPILKIGGENPGPDPEFFQGGSQPQGFGRRIPVMKDDVNALTGKRFGDGPPDSSGRPRDQGRLPGQVDFSHL